MRWLAELFLLAALGSASAQAGTPEPQWFSLTYSDLQPLQLDRPAFKTMWRDRLAANNQFYRASGDRRFSFGTAPATEAHFFVEAKAQGRLLMVSIFNSAEACKVLAQDEATKAKLKSCPLRLLLRDHDAEVLHDGGNACFIEYGAAGTITASQLLTDGIFARFDAKANVLRLDARLEGKLRDDCAYAIPLPAWPSAHR